MSQREYVLLLGSNLGDTKKNIQKALNALYNNGFNILKKSEFLLTEPAEFASSNIFCNFAASVSSPYSPMQTLKTIKRIEIEMGRSQDSKAIGAYTDRIIDIDIVTAGNLIFECKSLVIPHYKHLFERDFSKKLLENLGK